MTQYTGKPLIKGNELLVILQKYLPKWNLAHQKLVTLFVYAVLKIGLKSLLQIAGAFDSIAQASSSVRRIERFLNNFDFCISSFGNFMIGMMGFDKVTVTLLLDRTEWKYGQVWINIWMLSVSANGISIPFYWRVVNKKGVSNQQERIDFMRSFFLFFPTLKVDYLLADREFIGEKWFKYLIEEAKIGFAMRLKENFQVTKNGVTKAIKVCCRDAKAYQYCHKGHFMVCGVKLHISVTYLGGELLILGTLERDLHIFEVYKKRWQIETLFKGLKTQGFCLENTAITDAKKIEKLLFLLAIAFVWAYKTGIWLNEQKPIRICQNGNREFSFFRYGLIYLQNSLLNSAKYQQVIMSIKICRRTKF
jgi:hypothetical protein